MVVPAPTVIQKRASGQLASSQTRFRIETTGSGSPVPPVQPFQPASTDTSDTVFVESAAIRETVETAA
jgi:hypothetical protein